MNVHDQSTGKSLSDKYRPNTEQFPNKLKHVIRFGKNHRGKKTELLIPEHLQEHFWVGMLRDYIHANPPKASQAHPSKRAMEIIISVFEDYPHPDMRQFGKLFVEQCKLEGLTGSIRAYNIKARSYFASLVDIIDDVSTKFLIREFAGIRGSQSEFGTWPHIKEDYQPQKSLEQHLQVDGYDNLTDEFLIKCFTEFSYSHLKKWSEIRTRLRKQHASLFAEICLFISDYGIEKIQYLETCLSPANATSKYSDEDLEVYQDYWRLVFKVVKSLDDDFIILNAASQTNSKYFDPYFEKILQSENKTDLYLEYFEGGSKHKNPWKAIMITRQSSIFPQLPLLLLDLVRPTIEERMCVSWVLAFKRIQKSNIDKLLFESVTEGAGVNGAQQHKIQAYKKRNGKAATVTYNKNSPWGRSITLYKNEAQPHSNSLPADLFLDDKFVGNIPIQNFGLSGLRNFAYLEKGVSKQLLGLNHVSDDSFKFLQALFRQHAHKRTTSLAVAYFCQSSLYEDLNDEISAIRVKDDMLLNPVEKDRFEQEIEAERQFHSLETRNSVYKSRSKTKLKLKLGEQLAVAVSDEMHATVEQLLEAKSQKSAVLSFKEIQREIGLTDSDTEASPEAILAAAKAQDYIVQRNGFVTKNGQTYIFDCGLVARFMLEARAHIEDNNGKGLEQVFMSQGREKGLNIWAEYIFLDYILEHCLSPSSIKSALQDYAHLEGKIPHRPLTEGGVI